MRNNRGISTYLPRRDTLLTEIVCRASGKLSSSLSARSSLIVSSHLEIFPFSEPVDTSLNSIHIYAHVETCKSRSDPPKSIFEQREVQHDMAGNLESMATDSGCPSRGIRDYHVSCKHDRAHGRGAAAARFMFPCPSNLLSTLHQRSAEISI